jgi:hypothetical protein
MSDTMVHAPTTRLQPLAEATYQEDDLIGAAEGVFGKGAQGLGKLIEDILKKQGRPNGYIVGREGGGALVVGLRYGSGTLTSQGRRPKACVLDRAHQSVLMPAPMRAAPLCWSIISTIPKICISRFPSGEGVAYLVGGFNASYLRRGDMVLIPIRVGPGSGLAPMSAI